MPEPCPKPAVLMNSINAGQQFLGRYGGVKRAARIEAIIASAAILLGKCFSKITQQKCPAASRILRVIDHFLQLFPGDLAFLGIGFLINKARLLDAISAVEKQKALALQTISSGAASFLVITLHVFGEVIMNNKTHVRFVDSHSESN